MKSHQKSMPQVKNNFNDEIYDEELTNPNTSTPSTSSEIPNTETPIASPKDELLCRTFDIPPPGVSILPMIEKRLEEAIQNVENVIIKGKSRILCPSCPKDFNDKAALRIHYPAVHMKTMYRCTIPGCGLWFSSKRSRNRHSLNLNPELHSGKISRPLPAESILIGEADDDELREAMNRARRKGISTDFPAPRREHDSQRSSSIAMAGPLSQFLATNTSSSLSKSNSRTDSLKRRGSTCSSNTEMPSAVSSPKMRISHSSSSMKETNNNSSYNLPMFGTPSHHHHSTFTSLLNSSNAESWDTFMAQFPSTDLDKPNYPQIRLPSINEECNHTNISTSFPIFAEHLLKTLLRHDINGFFQGPCPLIGSTVFDPVISASANPNNDDAADSSSSSSLYQIRRARSNPHQQPAMVSNGLSLKKMLKAILRGEIKDFDSLKTSIENYFKILTKEIYPINSLPALEAQRLWDLCEKMIEKAMESDWYRNWCVEKQQQAGGRGGVVEGERNGVEIREEARLHLMNPDNNGRVNTHERIETIGEQTGFLREGSHRLVFDAKTSNVNCIVPYEYLDYGPYSSFAPTYDSAKSNCTHAESHLLLSRYPLGVHRLDPLAEEIIPEPGLESILSLEGESDLSLYLLNAFTRSILRNNNKATTNANKNQIELKESEKDGGGAGGHLRPLLVDLDADPHQESHSVSSSSGLLVNGSDRLVGGGGDKSIKNAIQEKLDATGQMINELNEVQKKRLLLPPYMCVQATVEERNLAHNTLRNLVDLTSKCSPGDVVNSAAVRKALNCPL